jgi:excinuclease ABC subunit C
MPIRDLKRRIDRLPEQPGVYLYSNAAGETIYVGKARSLRGRVRSYLGARGTSPKTDALLNEADGIDVILTDSVVEALALENNLIKQRRPKYNILLRDDKTYPFLRLTTAEAFPRVLVARRVERDGSVYAGPFMPASLARRVMALSHRVFGLRSRRSTAVGAARASSTTSSGAWLPASSRSAAGTRMPGPSRTHACFSRDAPTNCWTG